MWKRLGSAILLAAILLLGVRQSGQAMGTGPGRFGFHGHAVVTPHRPFVHDHFRGHPGFRTRIFIGSGFWWGPPWWWGAAYPAYAAPPVIVQDASPAYVQPGPTSQQPNYWYYCPNPAGYYPYIQECPAGWLTVVPPTGPPPPAP